MRELVIVSGKGGTGKTSVTASLAALADHPVICDCDVDAADLHLILEPKIRENHDFLSGHEAVIRERDCIGCGICQDVCRFDAITNDVDTFSVDPIACEGCGVCVHFCPQKAIDFPESLCGKWFVSETRLGPMVHAKLGVAAENSGKLVSLVRTEAKHLAEEENRRLVIVDGPPGIGCPVIASITGASQVLVVTEPTVSGEHDLERVLGLARHFQIPALVCINKWDINEEMTIRIEQKARDLGAGIAGRIRYDQAVTRAQILQKTIVETDAASAQDIRQIWDYLNAREDALK